MVTIKEYATQRGVTVQSVYKRINSKKLKDRLNGHIYMEYGVKCLDDVAIQILEENKPSKNTLSIVKNKESIEELNKLKEENTRLKDELIEKQNKYENVLEQLLIAQKQISEQEKQLLEYQKEEPKKEDTPEKKRNWFTRLFNK